MIISITMMIRIKHISPDVKVSCLENFYLFQYCTNKIFWSVTLCPCATCILSHQVCNYIFLKNIFIFMLNKHDSHYHEMQIMQTYMPYKLFHYFKYIFSECKYYMNHESETLVISPHLSSGVILNIWSCIGLRMNENISLSNIPFPTREIFSHHWTISSSVLLRREVLLKSFDVSIYADVSHDRLLK